MSDHIIKTTKQWQSTSMIAYVPSLGTLCVELGEDDIVRIKIGDGRRSYKNLPYVFEKSFNLIVEMQTNFVQKTLPTILSEYYRKEEIDQLLLEIHNEITNLDISEYVKTEDMKEYVRTTIEETTVPVSEEDLQRITDLEEKVDALPEPKDYDDDIKTLQDQITEIGNIDLSDYATKDYVDDKIIENGEDTGWMDVKIQNTKIKSSNIQYRMINHVLELCGSFVPSTSFHSLTLCTLSSNNHPHKKHIFPQLHPSILTPYLLTINTDGTVVVNSPSSVSFDEDIEYTIEAIFMI